MTCRVGCFITQRPGPLRLFASVKPTAVGLECHSVRTKQHAPKTTGKDEHFYRPLYVFLTFVF